MFVFVRASAASVAVAAQPLHSATLSLLHRSASPSRPLPSPAVLSRASLHSSSLPQESSKSVDGTELRRRVLQLYRECLTIGKRTWVGSTPEARADEMAYIVEETRSLFRANRDVSGEAAIVRCIEECEHRRDLALHYRNARPRLYNAIKVTPQQLRRSGDTGVTHTPSYLHSYRKDKDARE